MQLIDDTKQEDKFAAALLVARRARDLIDGAPPLTEDEEVNLVSQAIKEHQMGLLSQK